MDLRLLENVIAIYEERSTTRAAERLSLTQSALNQQLQKLETDLGVPLFIRTRSAWSPTPAGMVYIKAAQEMLQMKKDAYRRIQDMAQLAQRSYHIGLIPERGIDMFTAVYPAFHSAYPNIVLEPMEYNVRDMQREIASGRIDLGLMTTIEQQKDDNAYVHLADEEIFLAVPAIHPQAHQGSVQHEDAPTISLSLFADDSFIMLPQYTTMYEYVIRLFDEAGYTPKVLFHTRSNISKYRLVATGVCCALLPAVYCTPNDNIRYFRLVQQPCWQVSMCHRKDAYLSNAERYFLALCREYWQAAPSSPRSR